MVYNLQTTGFQLQNKKRPNHRAQSKHIRETFSKGRSRLADQKNSDETDKKRYHRC